MDRGEDAQHPIVLIVHHADGTAEVNGLPVRVRPGQDVREAAYLAAVAMVSSLAGTAGGPPVPATRVEPDGTRYPLMLYPGRAPFAADLSVTRTQHTRVGRTLNGLASLRLRWLVPVACGCVFLTALATVLLRASEPRLAQSQVNSRVAEPAPSADGVDDTHVVRAGTTSMPTMRRSVSAAPTPTPTAQSEASASPTHPQTSAPVAVGDLTVALFGGDRDDPDVSYVIAVSAGDTKPITLTYTYSGSKSPGGTRTQVLSGQTEYALAGTIPGRAFCGGTVTVDVSSRPRAANGTVTATTTQAC